MSLNPAAAKSSITSMSGFPFLVRWITFTPFTSSISKPTPMIFFNILIALRFIPNIESSSTNTCFAPITSLRCTNSSKTLSSDLILNLPISPAIEPFVSWAIWQYEQAKGQPNEVIIETYFSSSSSLKWPPWGLLISQYLSFGNKSQAGIGNSSKFQIISPRWAVLITLLSFLNNIFGTELQSVLPLR